MSKKRFFLRPVQWCYPFIFDIANITYLFCRRNIFFDVPKISVILHRLCFSFYLHHFAKVTNIICTKFLVCRKRHMYVHGAHVCKYFFLTESTIMRSSTIILLRRPSLRSKERFLLLFITVVLFIFDFFNKYADTIRIHR